MLVRKMARGVAVAEEGSMLRAGVLQSWARRAKSVVVVLPLPILNEMVSLFFHRFFFWSSSYRAFPR